MAAAVRGCFGSNRLPTPDIREGRLCRGRQKNMGQKIRRERTKMCSLFAFTAFTDV